MPDDTHSAIMRLTTTVNEMHVSLTEKLGGVDTRIARIEEKQDAFLGRVEVVEGEAEACDKRIGRIEKILLLIPVLGGGGALSAWDKLRDLFR